MNRYSVDTDTRLDTFLAQKTSQSRSYIQEQIKKGRVSVNDCLVKKASHRLKQMDSVTISFLNEPNISHLKPTPGNLDILYEDEFLLAVNKAAGVIVHPGAGQKENTLVHHLLHYLSTTQFSSLSDERPGIVHRLDQGTTGALLVAKDEKTQALLSSLFKNRSIKKVYQAITWGRMNVSGTIDAPIGRDRKDRKKISSRTQKARPALTQWKSVTRFTHFTHVSLFPLTGRTHQLRVHLSESRFPIVGDPTYGRNKTKTSLLAKPITDYISQLDHTLLHAQSLAFTHPITQAELMITAPLPTDFIFFLKMLQEHDTCPE